jgi:hypothetical protein
MKEGLLGTTLSVLLRSELEEAQRSCCTLDWIFRNVTSEIPRSFAN